jgi:hypothetical protein
MKRFSILAQFRLVTVPFRAFHRMLTVEDQLSCLESIRHHLCDGGLLILDVLIPSIDSLANVPIEQEHVDQPEFTLPDGRRVIRRHKTVACNRFAQNNIFEVIYDVVYPNGRRQRLVNPISWR